MTRRKGLFPARLAKAGGTDRPDFALTLWDIWVGRGGLVEYLRARREVRHALVISDPQPVANVAIVWTSAGQAATIGIFLLLFGGFLYIGRAILLPTLAAAVVALTLAPLIKAGKRHGISPWISAIIVVALGVGALALAATALAGPVSEWIGRAPEIGATIKQKLSVLDQPLAALHELEKVLFSGDDGMLNVNNPPPNVVLPVVAFLTPAAGELLLFFGTLMFFLVGQIELRVHIVSLFGNRDAKLRFLKIMRDIEKNLAGYLIVVTVINAALGTIVALGAWLLGFPNPAIFGLLAAVLNYVPYVGPAAMVVVLFGVGLVTFPLLGHAFIAPLGFVALTTAEGHFITPTIVGRQLTLNPLLVFLALAFWTWMWGPIGAFLSVPLSIIGLVVFNHLFPADDVSLPD
jgi:predicted PurR-regulated permease PerM